MECIVDGKKYEFGLTWKQWKSVANASEEGDAITEADKILKDVTVDGTKPKGGIDSIDALVVLKLIERMGNPTKGDEPDPLESKPSPVEAATK